MKKIYFVLLVLLAAILVACSDNQNKPPLVSLYDLTFMLDEETVYHSFKVKLGAPMTYPANPTKEGYVFDGWFVGETQFTGTTVSPSALTLYARFTQISEGAYLVRFYDDTTLMHSVQIEHGNTLGSNIPSTSKAGFTFNGWYINSSLTISFDTANTITAALDLYGKWTEYNDEFTYTGYYESVSGLMGTSLFNELTSLLTTTSGNSTISYGDAREVLEESDEWPIGSGQLRLIYNGGTTPNIWNAGATWAREHVYSKSLLIPGSDPSNTTFGRSDTDVHNLRAINPSVNSSKSNRPFHERADNTFGIVSGGTYNGYYDPGLDDRGDVARIVFYMMVRWPEHTHFEEIGVLSTFIEWHLADPPDAFELHRNEVIYNEQGNRNPFIDHEELAYKIWAPEKLSLNYSESFAWNYISHLSFNTIFL